MKTTLLDLAAVTATIALGGATAHAQPIIVPSTQSTDPTLGSYAGNYHVLHNGMDVIYLGLGSGGTQTDDDGLGTWIPGEELKGNVRASLTDDFSYKMTGFRESVCILDPVATTLEFPDIAWIEFDGRNGHDPDVFTTPWDAACLGNPGVGGAPYGLAPGASDSFVLTTPPPLSGLTPTWPVLVPNEGLTPASGGTATFIAGFNNVSLPIPPGIACWDVQFELITSVASGDDIDGWWHYARNAASNRQYWGMSNDELNLFHSYSVGTDGAATGLLSFAANIDYCLIPMSRDPTTHAALAPVGANQAGPYYSTATGSNPNGGFDLGRGSQMYSQSGKDGWLNPGTLLGNQDPLASGSGASPGISFVTYDNIDYDGDGDIINTPPQGSARLTWVKFDWDVSLAIDPGLAGDLLVWTGLVRAPNQIPVFGGGVCPQPITTALFPFYTHAAQNRAGDPNWPDPNGHPAGSFGTPTVVGESIWIPINFGPLCFGIPLALQYGTSGMVTPSGPLMWDPDVARVSGTRQIVLWE